MKNKAEEQAKEARQSRGLGGTSNTFKKQRGLRLYSKEGGDALCLGGDQREGQAAEKDAEHLTKMRELRFQGG